MEQELEKIRETGSAELGSISDKQKLESFRVDYLGRNGQLSAVMKKLGSVAKEERPRLGQLANAIKNELDTLFKQKQQEILNLKRAEDEGSYVDLSLPGRRPQPGKLHPITQIMDEVCSIFEGMGFSIAEGPDVELDHYNFEALNIPAHHPARDMHDTFYISDSTLLRTHTSPMQARIMEQQQPPLRVIAPGKVYRCDSDITHTPMFHQVEGFLVDEKVSFADLKGVLTVFLQKVFEKELPLRFRPSFFPFTEPNTALAVVFGLLAVVRIWHIDIVVLGERRGRQRDQRYAFVCRSEQHIELDFRVGNGSRVVAAEFGGGITACEEAGVEEVRTNAAGLQREFAKPQCAQLQRQVEEFPLVSTHFSDFG